MDSFTPENDRLRSHSTKCGCSYCAFQLRIRKLLSKQNKPKKKIEIMDPSNGWYAFVQKRQVKFNYGHTPQNEDISSHFFDSRDCLVHVTRKL